MEAARLLITRSNMTMDLEVLSNRFTSWLPFWLFQRTSSVGVNIASDTELRTSMDGVNWVKLGTIVLQTNQMLHLLQFI